MGIAGAASPKIKFFMFISKFAVELKMLDLKMVLLLWCVTGQAVLLLRNKVANTVILVLQVVLFQNEIGRLDD